MKKITRLLVLTSCTVLFFLSNAPAFGDQTFVVVSDIIFEREKPDAVSPLESMTVEELDRADWPSDRPEYHFYGENITGDIDKSNQLVVRTTVKIKKNNQEQTAVRYLDIKRLWLEPPLSPPPGERHMATTNTDVYLLPDAKSRKVLSLYLGEVVPVVGTLTVAGVSWSKARFCSDMEDDRSELKYEEHKEFIKQECSRYGYLRSSDLLALLPGSINESKLTTQEVPRTMRYPALTLSDADQQRLARDGFYIEETGPGEKTKYNGLYIDDMVDRYQSIHPLSPRFITSDLYLHSFHLMFDRMLQNIEEKRLYIEIDTLTKKMVNETQKELKSYFGKNQQIRSSLLNNLFFFSVAAKLFDPAFVIPPIVRSDVQAIADKIVKAEGPLPSFKNKIELGDEDFTQYRPRGHYVRSQAQLKNEYDFDMRHTHSGDPDLLERYFRGMMWYGRHAFLLSDDTKTISAILMTKQLETSGQIKQWNKIDAGLTVLIGKIDDWSPVDYGKVIAQVYGTKTPRAEEIKNKLEEFKKLALKSLPMHRIVSAQTGIDFTQKERLAVTAGFKFLGQRFTPDAYILNQLTSPSVGSDLDPRNLPTALDVMSLLGSKAAAVVVREEIKGHTWAEQYGLQAEKLRKELNAETGKKESSYSDWLQALTALHSETKSSQVFAMSDPWQYKILNTALSSWTELKHDTILYSEQSYAEQGSGSQFTVPPYEPPYVKGYVEPNPLFFSKLVDMVAAVRDGLRRHNLLTDEYNDKLQTFGHHVKKAYEISRKEIDGASMTRDDYLWIELMSNSFDRKLLLPRDAGDIIPPDQLKMALIADVATDAVSGRVLETAIGVPQRMIVAVKDASGGIRICTGYVYSWYEFADVKRWTDTEWKDVVYSSDQSAIHTRRPAWYSKFLK
jgi:hypothetical protein